MTDDISYIWNKLKVGNKEAYEVVFKMYYKPLCLFANKFTRDFELAREVVQELFVYLWENKHILENKKSIKAYLYASVRFNSIRSYNNKKGTQVEIQEAPEEKLEVDFNDKIEFAELQELIYSSIETLPTQCKKVFQMSRFGNLTYTKIAESLGISKKTVEAHMSKALKIIQKSVDTYFIFLLTLLTLLKI